LVHYRVYHQQIGGAMPSKVNKVRTRNRDLQVDVLQFAQFDNPVQEAAHFLYDVGFNVFPLPYRKKRPGYKWRNGAKLHQTRLHPDYLNRAFAGRCNIAVLMGKTSGNLFVLDCDTQAAFEYNIGEARKRNIPRWASETARGGHLYFRSKEGTVKNMSQRVLDTEVRGDGVYVLAPPSLHPDGVIYHWRIREGNEPPMVRIQDIDWLRDSAGNAVRLEIQSVARKEQDNGQHTRESRLSRGTLHYLDHGHTLPEGQRHNALRDAAWNMAGAGFTKAEVYATLEPIARASGLPDSSDPGEIHRLIDGAFAKPHTQDAKVASHHFDWERAQAYASNRRWLGRKGTTDRAVFLALVERARLGGYAEGTFRATLRELSEFARCSINAVQRSLRRMNDMVSPAGVDKASGGRLWRFTDKVLKDQSEYKTDTLSKAQKAIIPILKITCVYFVLVICLAFARIYAIHLWSWYKCDTTQL
jgi:hypothetical protein